MIENLENGLYISDFSAGEQFPELSSYLMNDKNCLLADNISDPDSILLIFNIDDTLKESRIVYNNIARNVPVHRVITLLKDKPGVAYYSGSGAFQWIKTYCSRAKLPEVTRYLLENPYAGFTLFAERDWLYSKIKISDPSIPKLVQDKMLDLLSSGNSFRYLPVNASIKAEPFVLENRFKELKMTSD